MAIRCPWVTPNSPIYEKYHDEEWGVPVHDDRKMFEFLVLESAQAGLSWLTVLKKREGYRKAFVDFDPIRVAEFTDEDLERLVQDHSIIRNRAKIKAAINNAQRFLEVQKEFGSFCNYLWKWVDNQTIVNHPKTLADYQARTPLSDTIAKDMKKRGFSFLGSTVMYAHLQATGIVNDHAAGCEMSG